MILPPLTVPSLARIEGVVFIGKAQEKARVFRTESRLQLKDRASTILGLVRQARPMVNHYYLYAQDRDFGPFLHQVLFLLPLQCQALP